MAVTCSNCHSEAPEGTAFCPSCGAALGPTAPARASSTQIKFDASELSQTDRIVGIATAILLISLFLPWYSASAGPITATVSALSAHGYLYVSLILSIAVIALFAAEALGLWKVPASTPLKREQLLLIATAVSAVLVVIAFLFKPSGLGIVNVGWSYGAFIGLIAAIVAVAPMAGPAIRARQGK